MLKESYFIVDQLAQKKNVFTNMDARTKVILCMVFLAAVIGLPGYRLQLGVFLISAVSLLLIRVPIKLMVSRIVPPVILGVFVFCFMLFLETGHQMFAINIAGFKLIGYREGFYHGLTVLTRIAGSVSILLFLSVSTPIYELGYALVWLRFPKVLVEILMLTYRYLFVLWDEGLRIRQAQTLRLGYPSWRNPTRWKKAIGSTISLVGMVFIRAYDRADSAFSAMQVRAYDGTTLGKGYKSWNKLQPGHLVSGVLILVVLTVFSV